MVLESIETMQTAEEAAPRGNPRVLTVPTAASADAQSRKLGLWTSDRMQVSTWRLRPGQQILPHMHPRADGMIVVLEGEGEFLTFDAEDPNPDICYMPAPHYGVTPPPQGSFGNPSRHPVGPASVGMVPPGVFYGLVNTGSEQLVAVAVTSCDTSETVWTTRPQ
jgi:oxalate decarboxylase/phosphoglucose isomerase-like protein (cupin superfamily)